MHTRSSSAKPSQSSNTKLPLPLSKIVGARTAGTGRSSVRADSHRSAPNKVGRGGRKAGESAVACAAIVARVRKCRAAKQIADAEERPAAIVRLSCASRDWKPAGQLGPAAPVRR